MGQDMEERQNNSQNRERKNGRNRGRRNNRKSRGRRAPAPAPVPEQEYEPVMCSICEKAIDSITQAIGGSKPGDIAHFDCVLRRLQDEEKLTERQRISYIGNGTFAVVEYRNKNTTGPFTIVKRIQIESKESTDAIKKFVNERKHAVDLHRKRR